MEQSTESGIRRDTNVRPYAPLNLCYAYSPLRRTRFEHERVRVPSSLGYELVAHAGLELTTRRLGIACRAN